MYVVGGHTDFLMSVFLRTGLADLLPELLREKVYVGSSAGAMIAGKRVSTQAYQKELGEGKTYGVEQYMAFIPSIKGLIPRELLPAGFVIDFAIKPHMDSHEFPNRNRQTYLKASRGYDGPIYGLRDDEAIAVDGNNITFIGSKPLALLNGKKNP